MIKPGFLAIILVTCILFCGCIQQPASQASVATPTPDGTTSPSAPQVLATLSDKNPNASFSTDPGMLLISFEADGVQVMGFSLLQGTEYLESVNNLRTNESFRGSVAFAAPEKGEYQLNITGTGPWIATVTPPKTETPLKIPVNISGTGTQVTAPFALLKGQYIFQRNEAGISSPYYTILYANGSYLMDANNTISQPHFGLFSTETFQIIDIPENGTYYMSVIGLENPQPWSFSIINSPVIPAMGPGPVVSGNTAV